MRESITDYENWEVLVPKEFTGDPLWKVEAYRLALFVGDIGWIDVSALMKDKRTRSLSDQLFRSLGSVSANIAEGYSRSSGRDKARFYEYALGSARESRDWYYIRKTHFRHGRGFTSSKSSNSNCSLIDKDDSAATRP